MSALLLAACSHDARPANVLLITLDTTRADALGCYGHPGSPTPNLDAIAAEGTRFDRAIATSSLTPVSHASILTGLDNAHHGVRVLCAPSGCRLAPSVPTLGSILKEHGWATIAVQSAFPVSSWFGLDHGFERCDDLDGGFVEGTGGKMAWDQASLQRRADETTDRALANLSHATGPFCLWVHYWDPHDGAPEPPDDFVASDATVHASDDGRRTRETYEQRVRYVDRQIGRLVAALRARGSWDDTIVVVVADHGEGLGDHDWNGHRILYQEQIRVPLLVRVPPRLRERAPVAAYDRVVRTTDVLPTILDFAGVACASPVDGLSLRAPIEGRSESPRVAFADEVNGYDLNFAALAERPHDDFGYAVIDYPWKYVFRPLHAANSELFDLSQDAGEAHNVAALEPERVHKLLRELARHGGFVTRPFSDDGGSRIETAAAARALDTLGYVQGREVGHDARWSWQCPDHPNRLLEDHGPCPACGSPCVPVARAR